MLRNEGDKLKKVVLCSPRSEYFKVTHLKKHNIAQVAQMKKAQAQHDDLKEVIRNSGCEVIDVEELRDHPNSVFTKDAAVCTPLGYVHLRMGLESRRGEEEWMARVLDSMGLPKNGTIEPPGTVEGGDVILAGTVAFVGHSSRTNNEGINQLSRILEPMGYETRMAGVSSPHLHIGGMMTVIAPDTVLCCDEFFPEGFFDDFRTIKVPAGDFISGNVISLGGGRIIAENSNTEAVKALRKAGFTVHTLDLSEFVKGTGGPSCLIMPVERN